MKATERQILIQCHDGARTVQAEVLGLLAIHPAIHRHGYTVTHLPTGREMGLARWVIPQRQARALLQALQQLDWDWVDDRGPEPVREAARQIIRACLEPPIRASVA